MEGMNEKPTQEFELTMKLATHGDDSDAWKNRRLSPMKSTSHLGLRRRNIKKSLIFLPEDHTAKVLASLVPDEIIYDVNNYSPKHYNVCLLFGDVSGFTELSEMYNKAGNGGPSRLTQVLNNYIGSMVQEILSHNGDVLKFSGDAFLTMWKCQSTDSIQDVVRAALDSAIMIQKTSGIYETDVGVLLKVKLAIAAGNVVFSLIGDSRMSHYVIIGQPVFDVKYAEKRAHAGEIIVSASAWHYINSNDYIIEHVGDGIHTKVKGVGVNWRPTHHQTEKPKTEGDENSAKVSIDDSSSSDNEDEIYFQNFRERIKNVEFLMRPSVNYAAKNYLNDDLPKFIIAPVMRGIELNEPLEYLTEMRHIVISFINVIVDKIDLLKYVALVDSAYKIVCHLVNKMEGCVNKVSLFDKDLMFVLLFGLKGYKSELESQVGLHCAAECYNALSKLDNVISTSVAVTTGVTYCGVVGHTLRREYTVIGLTVNKAARLMCAYPNKVTCDRETFLHSKLEARHFTLQEFKPLKGITNVGPVYEFKEIFIKEDNLLAINPFPILGRSNEIKLYHKLLSNCEQVKQTVHYTRKYHSALVIRSETRLGKTRLLEECIYSTHSNIPINRLTLTKHNKNNPYHTIQRILATPLGLDNLLTKEARTAKLRLRLQSLQAPDFLCTLNKIFNVNFEKSTLYLSFSAPKRVSVLQKILKQLCFIAFSTLWVIAIDKGEFIDDESWTLLSVILETPGSFVVITLNVDYTLSTDGTKALSNRRIRILDLLPIVRWYHAGIACQVLNVQAIPAELEKLLHSSSNGNPGWIESFLLSLLQSGGLLIQDLFKEEVMEVGLVAPPIEMLIRTSEKEQTSMNTRDSSEDTSNKNDPWQLYKFSYKDSVLNLIKEKATGKRYRQGLRYPTCIIAPGFKLDEVDPGLAMNVMIIQMFDSLTSYEQLLLKVSSVLGEFFPRSMLLYIMGSTSARSTALAIQKLFELRVLACAQGDFTQGDICMMFTQRLINPNLDLGIKCECLGVKIDDACYDLPKYASCGFLRFRMTIFRDTTYDLLTDNQKKEYHNKAIRYLEIETRRCKSCGNGIFIRMLGTRHDEGFVKLGNKPMKSVQRSTISTSSSPSGSMQSSRNISVSLGASQFNMRLYAREMKESPTLQLLNSTQGQCFFGLRTIKKLQKSYSLTRTFSYVDFNSCQCTLILNTMYIQMLEHCRGAVQVQKLIDAMLEYAYICIKSYNIPQALKILEECFVVVNTLYKAEVDPDEIDWKIPLTKGKIETLVGHARLELGQMEEAYLALHQSLSYYGYSFPSRTVTINWLIKQYQWKQMFRMLCLRDLTSPNLNSYECDFNDNLSECLSLLYHLYSDVRMWKHAELAATWSLNRSLASDIDFFGLCTAYANLLNITYRVGKEKLGIALEVYALKLCHRKVYSVEIQELQAVSYLYSSIFYSRLARAEVERSIHIGYITLKICSTIHAVRLSVHVMPILAQALIMTKKIMDAINIITELQYWAYEDTDNTGKAWYYCLCMSLILETGYTLTPATTCEQYFQLEGDSLSYVRDIDVERRYYTVLWLWHIRNDNWEAASFWYKHVKRIPIVHHDESLNNIYTSLYLLEGLLLYLVAKVGKRNIKAVSNAYKEISSLLSIVEKVSKKKEVVKPRLLHLKAYYRFIKENDQTVFSILNKAKQYATKHENSLELGWIEHSTNAWTNNLSSFAVHFWKEHCDPDNLLDYHEIDSNDGKVGFFTLPTPLFN